MSAISMSDTWKEFRKSKMGIAGLAVLAILAGVSIVALATVPLDTFKQWHNPSQWTSFPRAAQPAWTNLFAGEKLPEHIILHNPEVSEQRSDGIKTITHAYTFDYGYDDFPNDFMFKFDTRYQSTTPPLLQLAVSRPDGDDFELARISLPSSQEAEYEYSSTIFSTDSVVKNSIANYLPGYRHPLDQSQPEVVVFSSKDELAVLKGAYKLSATFFLFDDADEVTGSNMIIGGKVYGLLGTDELRRDLSIGIVWGAPLALFIGVSVASISVIIGMIYGVISGYRGGNADEAMMRANDVIYALPALPVLILLAVSIGKSIFLIVGYLIIFGWVGIAKISRSMALQIKNLQYIEAAELMGQSNTRIIMKHIMPQLLPYTFAAIAISVPGAIITEAGLSFLGLGDPTLPTWGQLLHDANVYGASARGLWWWIVPPGLMIALTGLAFVLIGTALDAIVNPKMKKL
ncbi:MAG: ABC transporter permease [Nitrososphaerales archaeon]